MAKTEIINYITGDATEPIGDGSKFIVHVCQNKGGFGKGFALALATKWRETETMYRAWFRLGLLAHSRPFRLGEIQVVKIEQRPEISVVNMLAQNGFRSAENPVPLDYQALRNCLEKVALLAVAENRSLHLPRLGSGYAGGKWNLIEPIINETLVASGQPVFVYDLPETAKQK